MSASKKQIRANRANAQKSTGPKSMEGKQMVKNNSVTYGLCARDVVIDSPKLRESRQDFDLLMDSLCEELQPQTAFQRYLVQKIADALWRSRRAIRAETAIVTRQIDNTDYDTALRTEFLRIARQIDGSPENEPDISAEKKAHSQSLELDRQGIPHPVHAQNILRYEMRLDRQLTRAYTLLSQLQRRQNLNASTDTGAPQRAVDSVETPVAGAGAPPLGEC